MNDPNCLDELLFLWGGQNYHIVLSHKNQWIQFFLGNNTFFYTDTYLNSLFSRTIYLDAVLVFDVANDGTFQHLYVVDFFNRNGW